MRRSLIGITFLLAAACGADDSPPASASVLLFAGAGASPGDVAAIKKLLGASKIDFATASSGQMNRMSPDQLAAYRLIIMPGGNFEDMGNGLSKEVSAKIRSAVRGGVNYLGICAGAFIAGDSPYNGINLTEGKRFGFYSIENLGIRKAAVRISIVGASPADHYWEDGPQLSGWGDVVARYPDDTPAVAEAAAGKGFVILTGIHPEAPESWRRGLSFSTPVSETSAYAVTLIRAALAGEPLPHG